MNLSVREAATLLGRPRRTIRARIARGEIKAFKSGGAWRIPSAALPLTEVQRAGLDARAQEIRDVVDRALPPKGPAASGRSLADLDVWRALHAAWSELQANTVTRSHAAVRAGRELAAALVDLGESVAHFDKARRVACLNEARRRVGRAVAELLSADPQQRFEGGCAVSLESRVIPAIGGLVRWNERRAGAPARDERPRRRAPLHPCTRTRPALQCHPIVDRVESRLGRRLEEAMRTSGSRHERMPASIGSMVGEMMFGAETGRKRS